MVFAGVRAGLTGEPSVANLVLGTGELAAGTVLLVIGIKRRKLYREWEHRSSFGFRVGTPSLSLLPGGGVALGISGRF